MQLWYLPTIEFSLWPCAGLLLVFIPVSFWHEHNWRRTLAEYGVAREAAGARDQWPPRGMRHLLGVQPPLVFLVAGLLSLMTALGWAVLLTWPHRLPYFDAPLNYFDRPYLLGMSVAGTAAVIGALALGFDLARSPWAKVAGNVRRAIYAPPASRAKRFEAAIAVDPGVPRTQAEPTVGP